MRVSAGLIFALGTFYSRTSYAQDFDQGNRRLRGYMNQQHLVNLPIVFENIADVGSLQRGTDTPIYWHILKSGGTTMKHVFGQCLNLVVADEKNHGEENVSVQELIFYTNFYADSNAHTSTSSSLFLVIEPSHCMGRRKSVREC